MPSSLKVTLRKRIWKKETKTLKKKHKQVTIKIFIVSLHGVFLISLIEITLLLFMNCMTETSLSIDYSKFELNKR